MATTKTTATTSAIYQIKVTLIGTKPPIWRRLLVPADLTMAQLHHVLQIAMGWQDCHLHGFRAGERHIGMREAENGFMEPGFEDERKVRLSSVARTVRARFTYEYDYGDGWEHSVVLEKILAADPSTTYPVCTGGKLAGPPEDCGGVWGYYDLVEALSDPSHERHEELLEWIGDDFDPTAFSLDEVNLGLNPVLRRRAKATGG